jgi:hypothetical protein
MEKVEDNVNLYISIIKKNIKGAVKGEIVQALRAN